MLVVFNFGQPDPEVRGLAMSYAVSYWPVLGPGPYQAKKVDDQHLVVYNEKNEPVLFGSSTWAIVHSSFFHVVKSDDKIICQ